MAQVTAAELAVLTQAGFTPGVIAIKSRAFIDLALHEITWGIRQSAVIIEGQTFGSGEETLGGAFQAELRERLTAFGEGLVEIGLPGVKDIKTLGILALVGLGLWLAIKVS